MLGPASCYLAGQPVLYSPAFTQYTLYSCCGLDTPTPLSSPHNIQFLWAGHSYTSILATQYTVAVGWTLLHLYPLLTQYTVQLLLALQAPSPLSSPHSIYINIKLLWVGKSYTSVLPFDCTLLWRFHLRRVDPRSSKDPTIVPASLQQFAFGGLAALRATAHYTLYSRLSARTKTIPSVVKLLR